VLSFRGGSSDREPSAPRARWPGFKRSEWGRKLQLLILRFLRGALDVMDLSEAPVVFEPPRETLGRRESTARAIRLATPATSASMLHSQTVSTFHPSRRSWRATRASRRRFANSLGTQ